MEKQAEVVIIGGGVIGASIAYHLGKRGMREVILLEKEALGAGSTGRCLGGIRYQFSTEIHIRFSLESFSFFRNFREELGIDPEFKRIGYLFLATSARSEKVLQENFLLLGGHGIPVELLRPEEIQRRWPFLEVSDVLCGSYCGEEGHAGPHEVLTGLIKGAQRAGCRIYEGIEAVGIVTEKGRATGVDTREGRVSCAWVVNAAGPYASSVGAMVGIEIPVMPIRRQVFTTSPYPRIVGTIPLVIDLERGWYLRREGEGFLLAGPQDESPSYNTSLDSDLGAKSWAAENALYRIPTLEEMEINGGWAGLYEISPDQHAILGEVPGLKGFLCANGFSGHGFMHSPLAGRLISELICDGRTLTFDISPLSLNRFSAGQLIREPMTAFRQ